MNENNLLLCFMHIPKTAGTSFKESLLANYKDGEIFPSHKIIDKNNGEYPSIKSIRENKYRVEYTNKKLFFGHYPLHIIEHFGLKKTQVISFLRNPIDRTISHLRHLKLYNPIYKNASLNSIFESSNLRYYQFDNLQTRYFMNNNPLRPINYNEMIVAKKNARACYFIGLNEFYDLSLIKLSSITGLNFNNLKSNVLETKVAKKKEFQVSPSLLNKIYESNRYDIELYNMFKNRLLK